MSWTNEDVRDEIYEQDEEEDEGPSWVDDKGKILNRPILCGQYKKEACKG